MKTVIVSRKTVSQDGAAIKVKTIKLSPEGQQLLSTHATRIASGRQVPKK